MVNTHTETVTVLGDLLDINIDIAGKGEPLVFLHSAGGLQWIPF